MIRPILFLWVLGQDGAPASTGLVVERQSHVKILDPVNRASEIQRRERVIIAAEKVRIEDTTFGTGLIVRMDLKKAYRLDRSLMTYSEVTFEQISAARKAFLADLAKHKERVKGTPDEAELEKIERGFQTYPVTAGAISPTGRKDKLLGVDLEESQLLVNGRIQIFKSFLDPSVPEGELYFQALSAISAFGDQVAPEMAKAKGFPIRGTFRYALFLDRIEVEEQVLSLKRESIPEDAFEPPKDWKRVPLSGIEPEPAPSPKIPDALRK